MACVVNDEDIPKINGKLTEISIKETTSLAGFASDVLTQNIKSLSKDTLKILAHSPTRIKGIVNLDSDQMIYISIPYDKGWAINDNGKPKEKFILSNGMTGVILGMGSHKLDLIYTSYNLRIGLCISAFTFCIFIIIIILTNKKNIQTNYE